MVELARVPTAPPTNENDDVAPPVAVGAEDPELAPAAAGLASRMCAVSPPDGSAKVDRNAQLMRKLDLPTVRWTTELVTSDTCWSIPRPSAVCGCPSR